MEKSLELVRQLVNDFREHEKAYLASSYQESQVRQDFIDKFFTALGWDVSHQRQKNPYEQEVKIENRMRTEGTQRRADYAFFIAPNFRDVKFLVEAKKPAHDLANPNYYYQTVRYGWNKTTPIAILTDFEEFHILDCRYKPDIKNAINYKIETFHYSQYTDEEIFKKIFYLFGRDAVAGGSLERFAETLARPRGKAGKKGIVRGKYQQVDEAFLELLDGYRDALAHAFKNKNPNLDGESLTEAVQRTLDRLVFIRFLEDKGIEEQSIVHFRPHPNLPLGKGKETLAWDKFLVLCRSMEPKYNGLVFKQHPVIDSPTFIAPDDKTFGEICEEISDPTSPYDFNTIPISILGSIYERFLGKIVTTTDKRAKVIEKPEVRKAGGVYYTPEYIVRYIVSETVGKLLFPQPPEGSKPSGGSLTPAEVAKLKIIDIACGSGSFLLEVYSQLLDYHTRYYNEFPEKAKKGDTETREGKIVLSHKKRLEILVNNIYGVDIDFQSTEVTQLSLYLKLMEDVTMNDAYQFSLLKERMLPDLRRNIVCGNSLIGRDILDGKLFDDETERILKPMNFEDAFPEIMRPSTSSSGGPVRRSPESRKLSGRDEGGFDVVVGNPPYVRIQGFPRNQIDYFIKKYKAAWKNFDLYVTFVEKGFEILNSNGKFGMILPNKFFKTDYGEKLRELISGKQAAYKIVDFDSNQVFDVTTYTCLLFISKKPNKTFQYTISKASASELAANKFDIKDINVLTKDIWLLSSGTNEELRKKLSTGTIRLLDIPGAMSRGSSSGDDNVFMIDADKVKIENDILRIPIFATDFGRYQFAVSGKWRIIFPYIIKDNSIELIPEAELSKKYPKAYDYLQLNKNVLKKRKQYREWYGYSAPRNLNLHEKANILVPLLADRASFAMLPTGSEGKYCLMASGGFSISLLSQCLYNPKYILGLLNSCLMFWQLKNLSNIFRGGWITCTKQYFGELPIRTINFDDAADKARHDHIVSLVEQMLAAKAKHAAATTESEKNRLDIQIEALDRQMDEVVYELYGLTEEEIKIVEGK